MLLVDPQPAASSGALLAEIAKLSDKPVRFVNTNGDDDHVGGNAVAASGKILAGGNTRPATVYSSGGAAIWAHENVLARLTSEGGAAAVWPTDTYFVAQKDLSVNGEPVQLLHTPSAHTDGDSLVMFRRSDAVSAGDVHARPVPGDRFGKGGSIKGLIDALNHLLRLTVPEFNQQGGTLVIPGHGPLSDEADVAEYRDMVTFVRDRIADMVKKGMTLDQVKAARPTRLRRHLRRRQGSSVRGTGVSEPEQVTRHGRRVGLDLSIRHVMFCLFVFVAALTASSTAAQGPPAGRQGGPPAGREGEHRPRDARRSTCGASGRATPNGACLGTHRSHRSVGLDRDRGLAMADGDAPKGRLCERAAQRRGRKMADGWDLTADNASGNQCRAFGAAAIMRVPTRSHLVAGRQHVEARNRRRPADTPVPVRIAHTFRRIAAATGTRRCEKLAGSLHRSVVQAAADTRVGLRRQGRAARRKPQSGHAQSACGLPPNEWGSLQ